ncbi:maltose ABC transporter substrate-binding protein [Propioniciclava sp. MC1595]|uniref:sugar ABC transporter substrate-binding protein n=1 Tax=Propioniciclava sp. MC1595 TaxID=2760308 RepID=UPI0016623749|nr:maltose ABC transporter substrate-binding protein [Propioniciclava sp. MC1595]MBB1495423.1 maltose ABC transporter substrate-binding protein [Propioniciclava sp. MC1595]QTE26592.1 maltose ABC transporter substrate-binding protein [Propioniciclava sp. MC1595]
MRKSIVSVLAAGVALSLAACGGTGSPATTPAAAPTSAATSESAAPAAGSLTIWVDETRIDDFKALGEDFVSASGVALDVVQKPTGDIKTDFVAQAPTGEGPDMIVGAHDWTGELVSNGLISPIELGDKGKLADNTIAAFQYDGALYGVPYAVENIALVRNNKILQDTPDTFDALIEQAKGAGAEFPAIIQVGDQGDAYHMYPIQTSFGAPVFKSNADGSYTNELGMEGAEGEAFATYLKKLADEKVVSASMGGDQAKQAFLDGKSPYMITGPWNTAAFTEAGMDISVLAVPSAGGQPSAPFLGVQGVYLSSKSENGILANQFLDYMATTEAQQKLFDLGGRVPADTSVAEGITDELLAGFAEAGKNGQPMPSIPEMGAVWSHWGNTQVSIINGQAADPVAAWKTMVENIKAGF